MLRGFFLVCVALWVVKAADPTPTLISSYIQVDTTSKDSILETTTQQSFDTAEKTTTPQLPMPQLNEMTTDANTISQETPIETTPPPDEFSTTIFYAVG